MASNSSYSPGQTPDTAVFWNDPNILDAAGGSPAAIRHLLRLHGQGDPSTLAVYQWSSRRKIPDRWRPRLVYCLLHDGLISTAKLFRIGNAYRAPGRKPEAQHAETQ